MNSLHGVDVLVGTGASAEIVGEEQRVKSKTAVYPANLMAADQGAKTLGDDGPAFTLQPGDKVSTVGPEVKNGHGVAYTPVTVPGHDGPFFVRASSLATVVPEAPKAPVVPVGPTGPTVASHAPWYNRVPPWGWLLIAVGAASAAAALGVGLTHRSHPHRAYR